MDCAKSSAIIALCLSASLLVSCGRQDSKSPTSLGANQSIDDKLLDIFFWSDFLPPDTVSAFEKQTGIKVRVSYFDTNEILEARLLTGHSGFDIVDPTAPFFQRQIRSGAYLPLDKSKLPNLGNLDPALLAKVADNDPGNAHGIIYAWGTTGIVYDKRKVKRALPNVPLDSWNLIFDPIYAAKLSKCGISMIDSPNNVVRLALIYLNKNPNAPTPQDLQDVAELLSKIRPYIRTIDTATIIATMANGESCIAIDYSGDAYQARNRANESKLDVSVDYLVPKEGALIWFDMLAIPKDAPHAANAHLFLNFIMEANVMATISNYVGDANAIPAALPLLDHALVSDPMIYPPRIEQLRLFSQLEDPPEQSRAMTRLWQKFKAGQ